MARLVVGVLCVHGLMDCLACFQGSREALMLLRRRAGGEGTRLPTFETRPVEIGVWNRDSKNVMPYLESCSRE